jgi:hypothetical protein
MKNIKHFFLFALIYLSASVNANSFLPQDKQLNNVVFKKTMFEEQEISYFAYLASEKELNKEKQERKDFYFIFHGESTKSEFFLNKTGLHNQIMRTRQGFISFNSTSNDWFSNKRQNIKDEKFIFNMFNFVVKETEYENYNIIAYSSGASLINKFLCEGKINGKIKKIILINGSGKKEWINNCKSIKNKNIFIVSGTEDDYYTYDEKTKKNEKYKTAQEDYLTMKEYNKELRIKLNCSKETVESEIENEIDDNSYIKQYNHSCNIKEGNNFEKYIIEGMGHNMLNTIKYSLEDFRGNTNKDIKLLDILK